MKSFSFAEPVAIRICLLIVIGLVFVPVQAHASIYVFTTESSFEAATTSLTTADWPAALYPTGTYDPLGVSTYSPTLGLTLTTNGEWGFSIYNHPFGNGAYTQTNGNAVLDGSHATLLDATFAPPVTAVSETISDNYQEFHCCPAKLLADSATFIESAR